MDDVARTGLAEVAERIRKGEVSSTEYATALLERIDRYAGLNAFVAVDAEALLTSAGAADRAASRGERLGALHGAPIAVKDNIDTAALPTTGGTPALRDHRPTRDAAVVETLVAAGALVLGKTNLHELAYGLTGENGAYGATANPYNPERIAGGSSSGTAAAVAAGLAPAGLGTDTGGSVRVPASLCGLAALRPTMGRYPQRGIMTLSHTRDTVGATARTVGDVGLLDAVLAGDAEPACPSAVELSGLRLGVVREPFWRGMESDLDAVLHGRLDALADRGVVIVDVALPVRAGDLIRDAGFPIAFYETVHDLPAYLRDSGSGLDFAEVVSSCGSADVKQILTGLLGEAAVDEAVYREALAVHRPALGADFRSLFADHGLDALAWPTTPLTAAPLGVEEVMLGGEPTSAFMAYTRTTNPGSILGWPGTTLPAGLDDAGLPVGMAFDGLPGSDRALLSLTRACEAVFGPIPPPPEARRVDSLPGGDQRAGDGDQIPRRRSGRRLP